MKDIFLNNFINTMASFANSRKSRAIFYHDIHSKEMYTNMSTHVDAFLDHISVIRDYGFEIVDKITDLNNQIEISFDDGFRGVYDNLDFFSNLSIPIKVFVTCSYIGKKNFLNKDMINVLNQSPYVNIQSHSYRHVNMNALPIDEMRVELFRSKNYLEEMCNKNIDEFCFPFGYFSHELIKLSKSVGYNQCYSSIPGSFFDNIFPDVRCRNLVQARSRSVLRNVIRGGEDILRFWYQKKHFAR